GGEPETDGVGIQPGLVPGDDTARFELPDTVQDGGGGHIQLPGDIRVADAGVALEQVENADISAVEHGLGLPSKSKIILPIIPVNNESSVKWHVSRILFVPTRKLAPLLPSLSGHPVPTSQGLTPRSHIRHPTSHFPLPTPPWPRDFSHRLP